MVKAAYRSSNEDVEAEDDVPNSHMQVRTLVEIYLDWLSNISCSLNMARSIKTDSVIAADNGAF